MFFLKTGMRCEGDLETLEDFKGLLKVNKYITIQRYHDYGHFIQPPGVYLHENQDKGKKGTIVDLQATSSWS